MDASRLTAALQRDIAAGDGHMAVQLLAAQLRRVGDDFLPVLEKALLQEQQKREKRAAREALTLTRMQQFRAAGVGTDPQNPVELAYNTPWHAIPSRAPALKLHDTKPLVLVQIHIGGKEYRSYWVSARRLELIDETLDFTTMQERRPLLLSEAYEPVHSVSFTSHDPSNDGDFVYVTEKVEEGAFRAAKADLFPWVWPPKRTDN